MRTIKQIDDEIKSLKAVFTSKDIKPRLVVSPILKPQDKENKLTIIQGDAYVHEPVKGTKYDTIYFDIWIDICTDNYEEMKKLHRRYSKYLNRTNPTAFMDSWTRDYCKKTIAQEKRQSYRYY